MHGGAQLFRRQPTQIINMPRRCGIGIAQEFHVAAKGQGRDLPARAALVRPGPNHRAKAQTEHLGMDAGPAANDVMAVFMHEHDNKQRQHEGCDRIGKSPKAGD